MEMIIELENGDVIILDCNVITINQIEWIAQNYKFKRIAYYHYE